MMQESVFDRLVSHVHPHIMAVPSSIKRGLETVGLYSNRHLAESVSTKLRTASHNLESRALLPKLDLPFIPQTSYALSASAIRIILNDLVLHRRRNVVELGAGMSTLFLAKVLQDTPAAGLISIDHDAGWLDYLDAQLERIGARKVVQLVHAPLEPTESKGGVAWYAKDVVTSALSGVVIDSLIVDGPKARHRDDTETRSHALGVLKSRLNPQGHAIFMDDINRPGEKKIYERWANEFALEKVPDAEFCGMGILVPRDVPLKFKIV